MLTRTAITAARLLILVASSRSDQPAVLAQAAHKLGESPTYLAKVARMLVRAGILRASRGVGGGVTMNRAPAEVSLLAIVEACQGAILPDFCHGGHELRQTCAFHQAAAQLHQGIIGVLTKWTLAELLRRPGPLGAPSRGHSCWIQITRQNKRQGGRTEGAK
jgi:Rrf2 family protein